MAIDEGRALQAILASLNAISEKRDRYEPFLDQIRAQWSGVSFSVARLLILLAREQLQNCMFQRMVDWYEAAIDLPPDAVKYEPRLNPPVSGMSGPEFARTCLSAA